MSKNVRTCLAALSVLTGMYSLISFETVEDLNEYATVYVKFYKDLISERIEIMSYPAINNW